jgi:hypothetical protein
MIEIPLSQIASVAEFAKAVEAHRQAMEDHRSGEPGIAVPVHEERWVNAVIIAAPDTGPVATRGPDKFIIWPYTVIDDTPPPPTLDERKAALLSVLHGAAAAARDSVLSPARQQLLNLDYSEAITAPENAKNPAQIAAIDLLTSFNSKCTDISNTVIRAAVAIEDLTEATIETWKVPSF